MICEKKHIINLPKELKNRIKEYAKKNYISEGAVTRLALSEFLNRKIKNNIQR